MAKAVMPLSLLAVGAVLEGRVDYRIVDGNLETDALRRLDAAVSEEGVRVLGMTVMPGPQLEEAVPLTRELRRRHPHLRVVWGGYFPTMHPEVVLRSGIVDCVVRGHNDWSIYDVVRACLDGRSGADVPGVGYLSETAEPRLTPPAPLPDLETLPDFPYERIEMERYRRRTFMGERTLSHHSSYGCPFECNFCAVVNMVNGRYSAQSAEHAAGVAARLVGEYGADSIELYDNNFFVHESRCVEFADRIAGMEIGWWAYGRVDTMLHFAPRSWRSLRDSGLRMVFLGAETGSDDTLRRMNKGGVQTAEQAVEIAARMREFKIVPEMSFMLGNPPDPEQDTRRTMEFIRRIKRANPDTEIVLYIYAPVPSAGDLYALAESSGFHFPSTLDEWSRTRWIEFAQHRTSQLPWLSEALRRRVHDYQRVLHAAFPTITDRSLTGVRRAILRAAGMWRYHLGFYRYPIELRVLNRLFPYQRPDTAGF